MNIHEVFIVKKMIRPRTTKILFNSVSYLRKYFKDFHVLFCTNSKDQSNISNSKNLKLPEEPQNCCMSGCANCVWVAYAEEVAKILNDGGETAKQKIMEHVKDPNLRAFLLLELNQLFKKDE